MGERATTVLLVDDHPVVLTGLRGLLASDVRVVGEATTGAECLEDAARMQPDAVVLDLRLPDRLAPDLCRELRRLAPASRVVVLTGFDDDALLRACLDAGARGLLLKDVHELDLRSVLHRVVLHDELVLDPRLEHLACRPEPVAAAAGLTQREHDVLRLVARGMTSAQIAGELHLAVSTVRGYVQSILAKTGTHTRIEALAEGRRLRLI